jgi:outer membrane receptor protein involved in Fe transport
MKTIDSKNRGREFLSRASVFALAAAGTAAPGAPAFAQDEAAEDRIVVTGSRIARQDLAAPSPLASVDSAQLNITNTVNTEDYLNDLPQLIPSFDSTSNNPGDGTARLSLRGLGTVRTLILLDGKRMVPEGIGGVVDINNIPAALVERVEVVTGGASAVYGSDAVAGVVNFILKDDFEGAEVGATYQTTGKGDAQILNLTGVLGGNFADGKGNAVMAVSYTDRKGLLQGEREFSRLTLQEDFNPATPFLLGGSSNSEGSRILDPATFDTIGAPANCAAPGIICRGNTFDPTTGEFRGFVTGNTAGGQTDFYNYAPENYLQIPQERYNISAFASYEIFDGVELYGRGVFSHVLVDLQLAPTPVALTGSSGYATVQEDNPFLFGPGASAGAAAFGAALLGCANCAIGDTNADGIAERQFVVLRRYTEFGPRIQRRDTNTFLVGGGVRGSLGDSDQWKWDLYSQYSRSAVNLVQTGNINFGNIGANGGSCSGFFSSGCPANTLRGAIFQGLINIFGPANQNTVQADQVAALSRTGAVNTVTETVQVLATIGGETGVQMPWANRPVGVSVGVEYREEASIQQPDSVLGTDIAGFNQTVFVQGRYDTYEAFGEVDIPIISDVPFIQDFSINGGYRYSDYSTVGNVNSYFVGGSWQMIDDIRIRAQFQRAVRAPNISELFLAPGNGFPAAGDPCSGTMNGQFGLFQGLDAAQQAIVTARCVADGVPLANVGTNRQLNAQVTVNFSGFGAMLEAEKADTLTIGGVITPTFIPGFTMTVDYYDIAINNAIGFQAAQAILDECFLFGIASSCALTQRSASGTLQSVGTLAMPLLIQNQVLLTQRGIDLGISYRFDLPGEWGSFAWRFDGNHTLEAGLQGSPGASFFDCAGLYSDASVCGEPTPEWKFSTLGTWTYGPAALSLRYNWISSVDDAATVRYLNYVNTGRVTSFDSYGTLDITAQYDVNDIVQLTFGVQNVTAPDVPLLGDCCNEQANTYPGTYETLGRQYFAGVKLRF